MKITSDRHQGRELAVDGRDFKMQGYENGFFMGGCLFDNVTGTCASTRKRSSDPVLSVLRPGSYEEALKLVNDHEYGNGGRDLRARRLRRACDFASRCGSAWSASTCRSRFRSPPHFGGWKRSGQRSQPAPARIRSASTRRPRPSPRAGRPASGTSFVIPPDWVWLSPGVIASTMELAQVLIRNIDDDKLIAPRAAASHRAACAT